MENLYKLNEYSGKLPNPKKFPVLGASIIAIKDKPYMFGDGFMLDLSINSNDARRLKKSVYSWIEYSRISSFIDIAEQMVVLLTNPEFIYMTTYPTYILYGPNNYPLAIQVKYYRYFKNRYKDCQFYSRGDRIEPIAIKVEGKLVGVCMPIVLDVETIKKIKEERK